MRLYTRTGATQVADPEFGTFSADANGAFEFPDDVSDRLHSFHMNGKQAWETDAEREKRLMSEELERFRDPATLLAAVREMGANQGALAAALAGVLAPGQAAAASAPTAPAAAATPAATAPAAPVAKATRPRKDAAPAVG